jgi:hypothetical protein
VLAADPAAPSPAAAAADANSNRALSESGQFSVLGGSSRERSEIAKRSDAHWKQFTLTSGVAPQWHHRIVVQLHDRSENVSPGGRVYPLQGGGYRFQVDLLSDEGFRWEEYRRELTKLFLFSQVIAANPNREIQDRFPFWMVTGLHTLMGYQQNGAPTEFFAGLLNTRQIPALDEVLKAEPSGFQDNVSLGIWAACSAVFVQGLFDQPNGKVRFQALLSDLGTTNKPQAELLQTHFPTLRKGAADLETWWKEQMSKMGKRTTYDVLSLAETEKRLEELLLVQPPAPKTESPSPKPGETPDQKKPTESKQEKETKPGMFSFFRKALPRTSTPAPEVPFEPVQLRFHERYLKQPWSKAVLAEKQKLLMILQAQAFPLYRPVVAGYQQVLASLLQGQVKGTGEQCDRLEQERQEIQKDMQGVEDYINWFSATQIEGTSQDFDGYARALNLLEKLEQRKRPDPISRYLDAIERELNP